MHNILRILYVPKDNNAFRSSIKRARVRVHAQYICNLKYNNLKENAIVIARDRSTFEPASSHDIILLAVCLPVGLWTD